MALPAFYHVEEFAEMVGMSIGHIQHGCRNWCDGGGSGRAMLPVGYGAFRWSRVYVIYSLADQLVISRMFSVKLENQFD